MGRALRRVDVGEAVGVALRKAMPDICGDDARAPQAGGNRSTPTPLGRRSVTNAATSASAINNKACAASGAETSTAGDMDLHATWKSFKEMAYEVAGRLGKSSEIRYQGMTETTLALIADRTALRMKLAGRRGTEQQQQRTRLLKRKIQHSVRKDKRMCLELLASQVQKAVVSGNIRAAYKAVKSVSGKGQGGAADLQTMNIDRFTAFYKDLLGKPNQDVPASVQEQRMWARAEGLLADNTKFATP